MEFVDTSFLIALVNKKDYYHNRAVVEAARIEEEKIPLLTSDSVIIEFAGIFARPPYRFIARDTVATMFKSNSLRIETVNLPLLEEAWELYASKSYLNWTLVDCISMTLMKKNDINICLTSDQIFEAAGYIPKLRAGF